LTDAAATTTGAGAVVLAVFAVFWCSGALLPVNLT